MNEGRKNDKAKAVKLDFGFYNDLLEEAGKRVKNGLDVRTQSIPRMTKAVRKHPKWKEIKEDLGIARFKDD